MQRRISSRHAPRFGFVVALLALGWAALGMAPAMASTSHATPFGSVASGTVVPTSSSTFKLTGSGVSSLGRFTYAGTVQITSDPSNAVVTDVLTETLTMTNGDTLVLHCDQTATSVSPGVLHGTDTWTVTGGTGRFAHAKGSGTGSTDANLNLGTFTKSALGTISVS